ncbi:MAG: ribosome biogenesis GTPase Der [bacterium]|nr:ribosome biogenesis GTPase Der [bacterium]
MTHSFPKIAIIGRPNVGKSTLFNRLVGRRQAIVDDIPGVTRDRQYGTLERKGLAFQMIDTGGFIPGAEEEVLSRAVRSQVFLALEEAHLVFFMVDGRFGITPAEEEIARLLHREDIEVFLVVNKIDQENLEPLLNDFLRLGFRNIFGISAEAGRGVDELIQAALPLLESTGGDLKEARSDVRLAIVGQPNVGKSTLLNSLIGEDRAVVHHEAGTTLDPLDIRVERGSKVWEFVDTAGIKRKRSTEGKVEKVGVLKALESVRRAHIVLLVVDAAKGISNQDMKILGEAEEAGRGMVIIFNKWDLMPGGSKIKDLKDKLFERYRRQVDVPVIAISAKTKRGLSKLLEKVDQVQENFWRRISTGELNRVFQSAIKKHSPPVVSGKFLNLSYLTQSREGPPRLVIFCNHPKLVPESYLRYLERVFRKSFNFSGVPLKWVLRGKH